MPSYTRRHSRNAKSEYNSSRAIATIDRALAAPSEDDALLPAGPAPMDPSGPFKIDAPPPHELRDRVTPTEKMIVLCHLGVPHIDALQWSLTIEGMVARRCVLRLKDLLSYPRTEVSSVHQCCGSPLHPFEPARRVCNVTWTGVRLASVLAGCGPSPAAEYLWSSGADHGVFKGLGAGAYVKDLPIERVHEDVLLAYEMNGRPLPAVHGYPVRLVVPGFYGTNSVKWLTRISLSRSRAQGPFTVRWYNDPVLDSTGSPTGDFAPVWSIAPESIIVSPAPDESIPLFAPREIWGWAWADGGIRSVRVRTAHSAAWQTADTEPPSGRQWQRFSLPWTPDLAGTYILASRAESINGELQPWSGRRNAIYSVAVSVV